MEVRMSLRELSRVQIFKKYAVILNYTLIFNQIAIFTRNVVRSYVIMQYHHQIMSKTKVYLLENIFHALIKGMFIASDALIEGTLLFIIIQFILYFTSG